MARGIIYESTILMHTAKFRRKCKERISKVGDDGEILSSDRYINWVVNVMGTISQQYMNEMNKQFKFFATWEPGTELHIGDIVELHDNQFTYISTLGRKRIPFTVRKDRSKSVLNYTSSSSIKVTTKLGGDVGIPKFNLSAADAGMTVEFGSEKGIVFEAEGVEHQMIEEVDKLDQTIKKKNDDKKWPDNWVVISDLMVADSATILISRGKKAAISLKAKAEVPNLSLSNVNANFDVAYQSGMNTKIICQSGLTPLFKARGISVTWYGRRTPGPARGRGFGRGPTRPPATKPKKRIAVREIKYQPF
jgi:hypothetical protein